MIVLCELFEGWEEDIIEKDESKSDFWEQLGNLIHENARNLVAIWTCNVEKQMAEIYPPYVKVLVSASLYDEDELHAWCLDMKKPPLHNEIFCVVKDEDTTVQNPFAPKDFWLDNEMKHCNGMKCRDDDCFGCQGIGSLYNCDDKRMRWERKYGYDVQIVDTESGKLLPRLSQNQAEAINKFIQHFDLNRFKIQAK